MIGLPLVNALLGLMFAGAAWAAVADRRRPARWRAAAFWGLLAAVFLAGDLAGDTAVGLAVVALAGLAAVGLGRGAPVVAEAGAQVIAGPTASGEALPAAGVPQSRRGAWLFLPALAVPGVALAGSLGLKGLAWRGRPLVDPKQVTVVSLALGVGVALVLLAPLWRRRPAAPAVAAAGLLDQIGWAAVLPQALAALGAVFAAAGVGGAVGEVFGTWLPLGSPLAATAAYTLGMAAFTIVMGNAFAAFPVMVAAIGLPVLVGRFGADPAVVGALGMLSGFCGTLVSPLAANFNLVPVALLELEDRWAVIRVQAPTAAALLLVNTALLYLLAFPR